MLVPKSPKSHDERMPELTFSGIVHFRFESEFSASKRSQLIALKQVGPEISGPRNGANNHFAIDSAVHFHLSEIMLPQNGDFKDLRGKNAAEKLTS